MVISSFISSVLILALGVWAYVRLEASMNLFSEKQLLIEPAKFSFKMWKDMPVSMYQSFTFFNLTNWAQVKASGQKPRFVEVGPYVYKTLWSKADVNFFDDDKQVSFAERKQWHFQAHLSRGHEEDLIWTINTPLMTALVLIQNAPVITRNIVSLILDGLGEGAFIRRPIRSLLFDGYSDLIVSVGPLFDRRFANFNGKFAYLYNKNDSVDGHWTVSTGHEDVAKLNKINRFQSSIVNMTSQTSGQPPQGLNEVKPECAAAWSLDQSTNGQLFAPFNRDNEQLKLQYQLLQIKARNTKSSEQQASAAAASQRDQQHTATGRPSIESSIVQAPKRFFSRISAGATSNSATNSAGQSAHAQPATAALSQQHEHYLIQQQQQSVLEKLEHLHDFGKFIFYPDLCRPIHLLPGKLPVTSDDGIEASRYYIDPRVFMNSSQVPSNKCYEMNPRPALANALAATINSVTGANVNVPNLVPSGSSPFALFIPPNHHNGHHSAPFSSLFGGSNNNAHQQQHSGDMQFSALGSGLFERSNSPTGSFLNNALQSLSASANQAADQLAASASNSNSQNAATGRLGRVRQLFSNIVSQRMSGASPLLPSLSAGPAGLFLGTNNHHGHHQHHQHFGPLVGLQTQPRSGDLSALAAGVQPRHSAGHLGPTSQVGALSSAANASGGGLSAPALASAGADQALLPPGSMIEQQGHPNGALAPQPAGASDRWITQFRFKWPRGVFSIGQCQLGAPIYVSLPHFLDADEYYLEQVDGLKPNRSLHEFYIDVESTLHSVPVGAKARLQLNVATPELRFRNIPNAMIPVLWQEVTFKMDKPVATLLYWSFTMSSTIYTGIAIALIVAGLGLLILSLVSTIRRQARQSANSRVADSGSSCVHADGLSSSGSSRRASSNSSTCSRAFNPAHVPIQRHHLDSGAACQATLEGQRSSWQHVMLNSINQQALKKANQTSSLDTKLGAITNRAFSCSEMGLDTCDDRQANVTGHRRRSPKQPNDWSRDWSRASSHCELVSGYGLPASPGAHDEITASATNAPQKPTGGGNCLLTCIRHSSACAANCALGACDTHSPTLVGTIVRQRQPLESLTTTTSDIDTKTTLSSTRSGSSNSVGSCSSIIHGAQPSRTFHKGSRTTTRYSFT